MTQLRIVWILRGHSEMVRGVAVTQDASRALSGASDNTVRFWDLHGGSELHTLRGHVGSVRGVALSRTCSYGVSASSDRTLKVWDLERGRDLGTLKGHTKEVSAVVLIENPTRDASLGYAVSASFDNTVKVWQLETASVVGTFKGHNAPVHKVAVTDDSERVLSVSADSTAKVWDLGVPPMPPFTLKGHTDEVTAVAVAGISHQAFIGLATEQQAKTRDQRLAVTGSFDGTIKVWNLEPTSFDRPLSWNDLQSVAAVRTVGGAGRVLSIALTRDGRRAVVATDFQIRVWDVEAGDIIASFTGDDHIYSCAVAGDGETIVAGGSSGAVYVLSLR